MNFSSRSYTFVAAQFIKRLVYVVDPHVVGRLPLASPLLPASST